LCLIGDSSLSSASSIGIKPGASQQPIIEILDRYYFDLGARPF
jgi:hypothetical protein